MTRDYANRERFPLLQEDHEALFASDKWKMQDIERNFTIYESIVTGSARIDDLAAEYSVSKQRISQIVIAVANRITKRLSLKTINKRAKQCQ